jgi:hypothetical protein
MVQVRRDVMVGCNKNIFLSNERVLFLQENGLCTLNQLYDRGATSVWHQGWKSTMALNKGALAQTLAFICSRVDKITCHHLGIG